MEKIVLKRHPVNFYIALYFISALFVALGIALIYLSQTESENRIPEQKQNLSFLGGIALLILTIYTIYQYYRNVPGVTVLDKKISFRSKSYTIDMISEISLIGKQPFRYLFPFNFEGMEVIFKDGKILQLHDNMYTNLHRLKQFFSNENGEEVVYEVNSVPTNAISGEHLYYYKGIFFLTIRGISLTFVMGVLLLLIFSGRLELFIFGIVFFAISYTATGSMSFYFGLNDHYFVIRNHLLFWNQKAYPISDIRELVYEQQGRNPNRLIIILKNYKSIPCYAMTLSDKKWLEMKDAAERLGVTVRNECIYI